MYRPNNKTNAKTKFWRFDNWKAWLVSILFIVLSFPLIRYIRRQISRMKEQSKDLNVVNNYVENQNPQTAQMKADNITADKFLQAAAKDIAKDLGVIYSRNPAWSWTDPTSWSVFNPRGWTENDKAVADTVIKYRKHYNLVQRLYNEVYAPSGELSNDLRTLLDSEELKRVRQYINI